MKRDRRPWPADISHDVDEELASHVAQRREEYVAQGLDPEAAARAAEQKFGNRETVASACRRIDRQSLSLERRRHMLTDLRQDIGYAWRLFRRNPAFTVVAIVTLALGMGATTTIFTLANWALLRPVPGVAEPSRVGIVWVGTFSDRGSFSVASLSYPNLADVSAHVTTMTLGAYQRGSAPVSGGGQAARNVMLQYVTASYFDVLGVRMQLGRPISATDDTPPSPQLVAVVSHRLWRSMFQQRADVIGQALEVAGIRFTVVGVAAPDFHGTERLSTTDVWLPGSSQGIVRRMASLHFEVRDGPGFYELVARLRPGASWPVAQAELDSLRAWLREQYPQDNTKFERDGLHVMGPIGPHPLGRTQVNRVVGATGLGASALVLLIACANVAGLLTIKGVGRRQEIAVRKALGAGRGRLIRQQVAEGVLLWTAGGLGALLLFVAIRRTLDISTVMGLGIIDMTPPIDWRVLGFTAGISLLVGIIFSMIPAVRASRTDAAETMRAVSPSVTPRRFVGTSLAVFQLGAALTLLVGALLLVGTLRHLASIPLGFVPEGLHAFFLQPSTLGYSDAESLAYGDEFLRQLRLIPGVQGVTAGRAAPFLGSGFRRPIKSADALVQARPFDVNYIHVFDGSYFSVLGMTLVRGRTFSDTEIEGGRRGDARVVILTERVARQLFGSADPIGREIVYVEPSRKDQRFAVVGVVGDVRYRSLTAPPEDIVYEPAPAGAARRDFAVLVRAAEGVRVPDEARRIATAINPTLPLTLVPSMKESIGRARSDWDALARLLGVLAILAGGLSSVGLYGVIAHGVAGRRREFGIRAALGATSRDVWRLVLREAATIVGAGLAIGLAGAYVFSRVLSARLVGVSPLDPLLWSGAVVLLVTVALAAALRPAIAASRVDVSETLRAL